MQPVMTRIKRLQKMVEAHGIAYAAKRVLDSAYAHSIGRALHKRHAKAIFAEPTRKGRFEDIYARNYWGNLESRSGTGSTLEATETIRLDLEKFLAARNITSMFDAPCGDWNWMPRVKFPQPFTYIGGEIVAQLVEDLTRAHGSPSVSFRRFDIVEDEFPKVDVWFCRDCLFHLSFADMTAALANFARSEVKFAVITCHYLHEPNTDISTGDFRCLNLLKPPIRLPEPLEILQEAVGAERRYMGVWSREQIAEAVSRFEPGLGRRPVAAA